jgi:hypothetical protein
VGQLHREPVVEPAQQVLGLDLLQGEDVRALGVDDLGQLGDLGADVGGIQVPGVVLGRVVVLVEEVVDVPVPSP